MATQVQVFGFASTNQQTEEIMRTCAWDGKKFDHTPFAKEEGNTWFCSEQHLSLWRKNGKKPSNMGARCGGHCSHVLSDETDEKYPYG
jgi:hypothetical protein